MDTTVLQRSNYSDPRQDKSFVIEMNETPYDLVAKDVSYQTAISQANDHSYFQATNHFQGSALSLSSRSFLDQTDIQPLTKAPSCLYHECAKFHQGNTNKNLSESPSSSIKNFFLYIVTILFIVWIITYTTLTQFHIL